jgi:transcriptional regulator with XRE-family HTH domain
MQSTKEVLILIGNNIHKLRKAKGWSQAELALNVGIHKSYIGAIEKGKRNISLLKLAKFAKVFHITIEYLIEDS